MGQTCLIIIWHVICFRKCWRHYHPGLHKLQVWAMSKPQSQVHLVSYFMRRNSGTLLEGAHLHCVARPLCTDHWSMVLWELP